MENTKVELSFLNRTWHHWPTILFLVMGLLMFYISTVKPPNPTPATMPPKSIIIFGLILCGLAIVTFIWLESKLKFEKIEIKIDQQQLKSFLRQPKKIIGSWTTKKYH